MTACCRPELPVSGYWTCCQQFVSHQPMPGFGTCERGVREDNGLQHGSPHPHAQSLQTESHANLANRVQVQRSAPLTAAESPVASKVRSSAAVGCAYKLRVREPHKVYTLVLIRCQGAMLCTSSGILHHRSRPLRHLSRVLH